MRKYILLLSPCIFLSVIILSAFPKIVYGFSTCKVGSAVVGNMHTYDSQYGYSFLVKGHSGTVEFAPNAGVVQSNDVQFRAGGGSWFPYSSTWGNPKHYFGGFSVPNNSACGNWWTNTMYRYVGDGQNHYCNDLTVKYALGSAGDFLNQACLESSTPVGGGGCQMDGVTANTRQAGFHDGYYIRIIKTPGETCSNYKFCIQNGISTNCGAMTDYDDVDCTIWAGRFSWPISGGLRGYVQYPATYHFAARYTEAPVQLYEFINNNYCGGSLVDVTPTPTPTCAVSNPGKPQLVSPDDGATTYSSSVTMTWTAPGSWGNGCPNNNRYKVYFTSNASYASDNDLSNDGLTPVCDVGSGILQCVKTGL